MTVGARPWAAAYFVVVVAFLAMCARYYHPRYGFTAFIDFPAGDESNELPAVRAAPHYHDPGSTGYDGQFYAQLAVEPLLRDPAIDRAVDLAPYRAHRILFSWTAYAMGLGRPAWILQAYALQNVLAWLGFAWLLCRWMPPVSARAFVLWSATLLSHGWLASVQNALPDGPSALLLALGVVATEAGRPGTTSLIVGVSALAREPNLLGAALLFRFLRRNPGSWLVVAGCALVCLVPVALWFDYLRSIYRSQVLVGGDHLTTPLSGLFWKINRTVLDLRHRGLTKDIVISGLALTAFCAQGAWLLWRVVAGRDVSPWALVAAPFLLLGFVLHPVVFEGIPGAYTRVLLPLTVGVNVLLGTRPRPAPWWLIGLVNLGAISGVMAFWR